MDDDAQQIREQNRNPTASELAAIDRLSNTAAHGAPIESGEVSRLLAVYAQLERPNREPPKRVRRAHERLAEQC